jgi:hypothetical protein
VIFIIFHFDPSRSVGMKKTLVIIFPAMMIGLELKRGAEKEAFHA